MIYAGSTIKIPRGVNKRRIARTKTHRVKLVKQTTRRLAQGTQVIYKVKPGDNAWRIAQLYHLDWRDIALWNNIDDVRRLKPGQKLVLYLRKPKKVMLASAFKNETKSRSVSSSPQKANIVNETLISPRTSEKSFSYTVRSGDTLWAIARRFNIEPEQIRSLNNIKSNLIRPGDILTLPTEEM